MSVLIQKSNTRKELAQYLYAVYFSPVPSTFFQAIKRQHFKTWPSLTPNILKHATESIDTVQGHQHQDRQGMQSTSNQKPSHASLEAIKVHFIALKSKKQPKQSRKDFSNRTQ